MEEQISSPTFTIVNEYIKNDEKIYQRTIGELITIIFLLILSIVVYRYYIDIENLKEYIAVPIEYGKEKNMYAFESKNSEFKEVGILNKSLVIFDTEERYISRDLVAIIEEKASYTRIGIKRYERGENTEKILGKIVGVYTNITY